MKRIKKERKKSGRRKKRYKIQKIFGMTRTSKQQQQQPQINEYGENIIYLKPGKQFLSVLLFEEYERIASANSLSRILIWEMQNQRIIKVFEMGYLQHLIKWPIGQHNNDLFLSAGLSGSIVCLSVKELDIYKEVFHHKFGIIRILRLNEDLICAITEFHEVLIISFSKSEIIRKLSSKRVAVKSRLILSINHKNCFYISCSVFNNYQIELVNYIDNKTIKKFDSHFIVDDHHEQQQNKIPSTIIIDDKHPPPPPPPPPKKLKNKNIQLNNSSYSFSLSSTFPLFDQEVTCSEINDFVVYLDQEYNEILVCGGSSQKLYFYDTSTEQCFRKISTDDKIGCLFVFSNRFSNWIVCGDFSFGRISVFDTNNLNKQKQKQEQEGVVEVNNNNNNKVYTVFDENEKVIVIPERIDEEKVKVKEEDKDMFLFSENVHAGGITDFQLVGVVNSKNEENFRLVLLSSSYDLTMKIFSLGIK